MGQNTKIQWCDDTHNYWRGCAKVSPGCANCYAEQLVTTRLKGKWGKGAPRVRSKDFDAPLCWNKKPKVCNQCGLAWPSIVAMCSCNSTAFHRRRVFSLSLGDWLDDEVQVEWLAEMLDVIRRCPDLDFLLLTKRPGLWRTRLARAEDLSDSFIKSDLMDWIGDWFDGKAPQNIWIGTSVENQAMADLRIPQLLAIPAAVRFLSVEPLLEEVKLVLDNRNGPDLGHMAFIDWVIVGAESGDHRRDCGVEAVISVANQCKAAGVPCFVKQDCARKPGQQGRIPDEIWKLKEFPR